MLDAGKEELPKVVNEKTYKAILANRQGKIKVKPGYDGLYGIPLIEETTVSKEVKTLDEF